MKGIPQREGGNRVPQGALIISSMNIDFLDQVWAKYLYLNDDQIYWFYSVKYLYKKLAASNSIAQTAQEKLCKGRICDWGEYPFYKLTSPTTSPPPLHPKTTPAN